ncbi:Kae1-like domain-containing protein [Alteribacter natronophilus]|uniref:Kae1-like domain-containing protein n=1 Tax=Alteribacter natronophilus TaxID=2583810 RepID=UPI00110D9FBD|nr:carbamoyltransferase HypF [Alteribacter natronophilus]TMW71431.1 carbamoyltransferase HypF [Alteribacter natronophilus]
MPEPLERVNLAEIETGEKTDGLLALGSNQKSAFAFGKGSTVYLSAPGGELHTEEEKARFEERLAFCRQRNGFEEEVVAADMHPLYETRFIEVNKEAPVIGVQHHHAHHVSCMLDNQIHEPCFGIILDGTGYGTDGCTWGFEFLYGDAAGFRRLGHLRYSPLPGGDRAVREPWRAACGMLLDAFPGEGRELADSFFPEKKQAINLIEQMVRLRLNTPPAGTCGRLFDAVSAVLGLCHAANYEGEGAVLLTDCAQKALERGAGAESYSWLSCKKEALVELDMMPALWEIVQEKSEGKETDRIALRFHRTIIDACVSVTAQLAALHPGLDKKVVLSGGSFQNPLLKESITCGLQEKGFTVYSHNRIPCHDGGLAAGQLLIAAQQREQMKQEGGG